MSEQGPPLTFSQWRESVEEQLHTAPFFDCAACHARKKHGEEGHAHMWQGFSKASKNFGPETPMAVMAANKISVYVLCAECEEVNPNVRERGIVETLAKHGLFDPPSPPHPSNN